MLTTDDYVYRDALEQIGKNKDDIATINQLAGNHLKYVVANYTSLSSITATIGDMAYCNAATGSYSKGLYAYASDGSTTAWQLITSEFPAKGADGVDGVDGENGSDGSTGATGARGPQGVPGLDGSQVEANPTGTATGTLSKISIDNTIYSISGHIYQHYFSCYVADYGYDFYATVYSTTATAYTQWSSVVADHDNIIPIFTDENDYKYVGFAQGATIYGYMGILPTADHVPSLNWYNSGGSIYSNYEEWDNETAYITTFTDQVTTIL